MDRMLVNKWTVVTGASAGIGLACARLFAQNGSNLAITARREDRLDDLRRELEGAYGVEVKVACFDVRDQGSVQSWAADLCAERAIDILINNAGLSRGLEKLQDGVLQNWEEMIDTNLKGLLYVARAISPSMIARSSGTIINIASIAGRQVYIGGNVYCATKAAVRTISEAMQLDFNGTGVRVTNIDPGLVETEFSEVRFRGDTERASRVYQGYQPLSGHDIAEIALYCASRPPHVSIQDILVTPLAQASATLVHKVGV